MILLNPGPVNVSPRVTAALGRGDICHREPECAALLGRIREQLLRAFAPSGGFQVVVLSGSGTAALELATGSVCSPAGRLVIATNGVYGERMANILSAHRKPHEVLEQPWTSPLDLDAATRMLDRHPEISHVATVQHETTTGRLNDVDGVGALCRERNLHMLLDGVSSFGAERIDPAGWNLEAVAGTANKCLHGVPGLSFVIGHRDAWGRQPSPIGSVYLNLYGYHAAQHGAGYSPYTQSIQVAFALREAIAEHDAAGGWQARREIYLQRAAQTHAQLSTLNVESLLNVDEYSSVLRSYLLPENMTYAAVHDELKQEGFVIYAGQGDLAPRIFRLAFMGDIQQPDLDALCAALQSVFASSAGTVTG